MEATSLAALFIFIGFWYWMSERSKNETEQEANQKARNEIEVLREETKTTIHSRALKLGVDYTDDELDWICDNAETHSGKEGLANIGRMFEVAPKEKLEELMMKIEAQHMKYLMDRHDAQLSDETARRWQVILNDFRQLNPAQQKAHLAYIKKHSNELNEEQLHILELVSLGDFSNPAETDVMIGDTKLFSMRRR